MSASEFNSDGTCILVGVGADWSMVSTTPKKTVASWEQSSSHPWVCVGGRPLYGSQDLYCDIGAAVYSD